MLSNNEHSESHSSLFSSVDTHIVHESFLTAVELFEIFVGITLERIKPHLV